MTCGFESHRGHLLYFRKDYNLEPCIWIVEYYPIGWIRCERIIEDECINEYLTNTYPYHMPTYILGFKSFLNYMHCLNSHSILHITKNGSIYRQYSNSAWFVVEANGAFEAIEKARQILADSDKNTDNVYTNGIFVKQH